MRAGARTKGDSTMPNTKLTNTQERTMDARKAFNLYMKKYGANDLTPEEYLAELEYLFEVFKVKPNRSLYRTALAQTRR